jgi:hypothetical protein
MNAWTVFDDGVSGADSVVNLKGILIRGMALNNDAGGLTCEAIIQDAAGDWFVSDDTALVLANTTTAISATTTTWWAIDAPVIGTAINPTGPGTPDLSSVLGGGLNFTAGTNGWLGIEALTFTDVQPKALPFGTPSDGAVDVPVDQVLSWTAYIDANSYTVDSYDVYITDVFDPDPNFVGVTAANEAGLTHDPAADFDNGTPYAWRVDTNISEYAGPITGNVQSFTTAVANPAPVIVPLDNVITAIDFLPADLSAVVTDASEPPNVAFVEWTLLDDDVTYPAGAVASVSDTTSDLYAPTATFTTDTAGVYLVELTVNDLGGKSASRIVHIDVQADACAATAIDPNFAGYNPMDFDFNCVVDIADLAAFALQWLDDITLTDQVPGWPGTYVHLPFANGLVNGGFEDDGPIDGYGDFVKGWWQAGTPTLVTGANVYEGTYAVELGDIDGLSCLTPLEGFYTLPAGNHSVTFRYKGDLSELVIALGGAMGQDLAPTDGADGALVNSAVAGYETQWVVENATVASYTLYEVRFTVDTEATGSFYIGGTGTGIGYLDDFRIVQNSH